MKTRSRIRQLELPLCRWGGKRKGAGRKPKGERAGVSHRARPPLAARYPVHVTLRLRDGAPNLREGRAYARIRDCLARANDAAEGTGRARVVHYSVLRNHIHLLVEAPSRGGLSRGIQGLATRLARGLNAMAKRSGRLFADRYHAHILKTPREVRRALAYVLNNARHHGLVRGRVRDGWADPYSSAGVFDGWRTRVTRPAFEIPVSLGRTWLLTKGWRRHGLIEVTERPAPG